MELRWIDSGGTAHERAVGDLADLLTQPDGWVWLDVAEPDEASMASIQRTFGFHARAVHDCVERNHVPRLHYYHDYLFLVLHRPLAGVGGHVHYLELDQFIGANYLVTVHGPRNPAVALASLLEDTRDAAERMRAGRLTPSTPYALSSAIVSTLIRRQEELVNHLANDVGLLEKRVMAQEDTDPRGFLEELFRVRHALLTVRTMCSQSREVYGRATTVMTNAPTGVITSLVDILDQYDRVARISDSQLAFLQGVTDFYRARTDTKMTIAAERLAVIAAITLPVTATSSVVGMNVIVNDSTHVGLLVALLVLMAAMSLILLRWAKRQGWW